MEMTSPLARPFARRSAALPSLGGAALLALGLYAAVALKQPILAAVAGAAGLALLRFAWAERPYSPALIAFDAAAFAIFAVQRNDALGFWQLPGPWADVWRFDPPGATIALVVYAGGSIMALVSAARGLRLIEAVSLIATPFLFNLLVTVGADWRMAGLGAVVTGGAKLPFPVQVAIGRALILWGIGEAILTLINLDQRQPAAAIGARAWAVRAERRGRGVEPARRQRGPVGRSAVPCDCFLQRLRGARASGLMGDRLSLHRRHA